MSVSPPKTQFVDAPDGAAIAYRQWSQQGPPLLLANGITTSDFFWRRVLEPWTQRYRVITWDYKGHGDSGPARNAASATIEAAVDDMRLVLDATGVDRAPLLGFSMGCQVVLEACRRMPERVTAVGCLLGPPGRLFHAALPPVTGRAIGAALTHLGDGISPLVMEGFARLIQLPPTYAAGRLLGLVGEDAPREDIETYADHFGRMHHPTVRDLALAAGEHDATPVLSRLRVPLLIVAGDRDPFAPAKTVGADMHRRAVGSQYHRMPHGTHTSLLEHPTEIARVVMGFLDGS